MNEEHPIREGQVVTGSLFSEPMRVETVRASGPGTWVAGMVGIQTERFRKVALTAEDINKLTILDETFNYDGDGQLLRLGIQAYSLGIAYEFDLKLARMRFLLADDAGAGKTVMVGLLVREETRNERLFEIDRITEHVELSLTELLQRTDEKIGKASEDVGKCVGGAEGRLA